MKRKHISLHRIAMGEEKKQKKKKKDKKRKRDHHGDESDGDSQEDSGKSEQVSTKKHRKKSHKEKSKKKNKSSRKHSLVPEEVLVSVGLLTEDNYFEKHAEFATWLLEEQSKYFNDLPSEDTRAQFSKFVLEWNSRTLAMKYYEGIDNAPTRRTQHKWGLKGKDKEDCTSGNIYSNTSKQRKEHLDRILGPQHDGDANKNVSKLSERLGFRMSSFCPPKVDDMEETRWRKEKQPFTSELKKAGENAAARMFGSSYAEDSSDLSHFQSIINSSASLKIKKRDVP